MCSQNKDAIDVICQQWEREEPKLKLDAMATIGRLKRSAALLQNKLDRVFDQYELSSWEFDVLVSLRRSGAPYCLAPTALFSSLMITSGTMTNRMNRLEKKGLVVRKLNPEDGRSKLVELTPSGLELVTRALYEHVENEEQIMSKLSLAQRKQLDSLLKTLLLTLE